MNGRWRKICAHRVHDFGGFSFCGRQYIRKNILNHYHETGFDKVQNDDVEEMESHAKPITDKEPCVLKQDCAYEEDRQKEEPFTPPKL